MAGTTVIDKLIVELGLDPKKFTEGQKKAAAGLKELRQDAKETGDEVSQSADKGGNAIMALGKRVLTVAAIFKVLSYTTKNVLEASRATYGLANASRVLGESARSLRNFENIAEIMGGTAEGARKSIQGLKQSLFDLSFNGQVSNNLKQLSRLGVATQDRKGGARDFTSVYLDTAGALQSNVASGKMTESEALMFAESAGFDPGLARAMVGGRDAASHALARQEARRQITDADVAGATSAEQAMTSAGQEKMTAFTRLGSEGGGFAGATRVATGLEGAWKAGATGEIESAWEGWKSAIEPVTMGLGDLADSAVNATRAIGDWANNVAGRSQADRNNNPGNLTDPSTGKFRKFATREEGLAAGARQLDIYRGRGNNTLAGMLGKWNPADAPGNSPANLEAYIADVEKQTGISRNAATTAADNAAIMAAIGNHEGSAFRYDAAGVADALSLQQQAAPGFRGGPGSTTTVDIGEINVVTSATDANGIAGSIGEATRRKLTASQAPSQGPQ